MKLQSDGYDEWGDDNESAWYEVVKIVRRCLPVSVSESDIRMGSERLDPFVVDLMLVQPLKLSRSAGLAFSHELHLALGEWGKGNWMVRVLISNDRLGGGPSPVVWLEIDKCRVAEYMGRYFVDRCDNIRSFVEMYWSTKDDG